VERVRYRDVTLLSQSVGWGHITDSGQMSVQRQVLGQQLRSFAYRPARRWLCLAMPRWQQSCKGKASRAIILGKSEGKKKVIKLSIAVINDSKILCGGEV